MGTFAGPVLELELDRGRPLGRQIEERLRDLIRSEALPLGARLPSTRALAADLRISRGVVVDAYAQLAADGYVLLRRGAAPVVAVRGHEPHVVESDLEPDVPIASARFILWADLPDLSLFPRRSWIAAERNALRRAAVTDLSYGEVLGSIELRHRLAHFLARTRGVVADPQRMNVVAGSAQALFVIALLLRNRGARRIAVEDPGHHRRTRTLVESGLEVVPVPVDADGLRVDLLGDVDAVVVSPHHHYPLGVSLSPARRRALVDWAVSGRRLILEHDYDGHFRYEGPSAGALQGLAPEHVVYVGGATALLAPTVRLGWAVLPAALIVPFAELVFTTVGCAPRLPQLALAELIARGELDRHLRKARVVYRRRRDVACAALARHLPQAVVGGDPVGLFVPVSLPVDEAAVLVNARRRRIVVQGFKENAIGPVGDGLALGFAAEPEARLRQAIARLALGVPG